MIVEVYALDTHIPKMRNISSRAQWLTLLAINRVEGRLTVTEFIFDLKDEGMLPRFIKLMKKVYPKAKIFTPAGLQVKN